MVPRQPAFRPLRNEEGFVLVVAIIVLMLLTVIGISITTTTSIELQIAGNEKIHKATFFEADGATEIASELTEQNLGCMSGFSTTTIGDNTATQIKVVDTQFWQNTDATLPTDANRDFYFPNNYGSNPHTNVTVGGNTILSTGSAIQMVAGYEGKGKGAGGGGGYILYDIFAQRIGIKNAESVVKIQWRHIIGAEGACNY